MSLTQPKGTSDGCSNRAKRQFFVVASFNPIWPSGSLWLTFAAPCSWQVLNSSRLAGSMGVSPHTIRSYIDLLEQTFLVRVLPPYISNTKKRLIKSPKVYIRDSGILHSLLAIESMEDLFAHPVYGASYEGYVIENILAELPRWQPAFYRTSKGAEIDLVISRGERVIAIEIKSSTSPKVSRNFYNSIAEIAPEQAIVIAPVEDEYPLAENVMVKPLSLFIEQFT